jgi:chromosome segregation protein
MEARTEIETELKMLQREFLGRTYWELKRQIDNYVNDLEVLGKKKAGLEEELFQFRTQAERLEGAGSGQMEKFREIQTHFNHLNNKKNKLLEELSMVRGRMQSQKTSSIGDAKTLQIELHTLEKEILEVQREIQTAEKEQKSLEQSLGQKNGILQRLTTALENLYNQSREPKRIDWKQFEQALQNLDKVFNELYAGLERNLLWQQISLTLGQLKQRYLSFKNIANKVKGSPHADLVVVQQQLVKIQKDKEELNEQIRDIQLQVSKLNIQQEFLERDLDKLEQQRSLLSLDLKRAGSHPDEFIKNLIAEEERIQKEVDQLGQEIFKLDTLFKQQQEQENQKQKNLREIEGRLRDKQDELSKHKDKISALNIEKTKFDTQMEVLVEEIKRILGQTVLQEIGQSPVASQTHDIENKISKLKNQLEVIGGMDELTLKEYQETEARYTNFFTQVNDLKKSMQDLKVIMDELDEHIKSKFNDAFHKINEKFEYYFRILFNGGRAYLSLLRAQEEQQELLVQNEDESASSEVAESFRPEEKVVKKYEKGTSNIIGIDIKATPPGKKLTHIQALSGGERSLTSIALLCGLLTCFPSPFVVLDEVDAALDDANTIRFGQILHTLSSQTQFITITHNRETMTLADILYGVTMGDDGVSKLLSVRLDQAKQYAK